MIKHESAPGSPSATAQAHVPGDGASEVDEGRPSKPRLPLRPRIILVVVSVLFSIVMLLSLYFTARERSMVEQATQEKVDVMREDMRSKGIVLARSVALSSATAIAFKNYSFLRDVIRSIVQNDTNVSYGIIMSQTGMALIHTDVSKAGAVLDGPSDRQAIEAEDVAAFDVTQEGRDYLEVLAPIEVGGKVWGKVRFGLSLEPLNAAIRSSAESSRAAIDRAIARGLIAAL
ncbi:MAG TPA: hypothetical protein VFH51_19910, partial [Myxococcota bacterium]|nr:hypothetical protein [Myxococcota bacterium]